MLTVKESLPVFIAIKANVMSAESLGKSANHMTPATNGSLGSNTGSTLTRVFLAAKTNLYKMNSDARKNQLKYDNIAMMI